MAHIPVFVGGIIPDSDIAPLKKAGVKRVFTPGTRLDEIIEGVRGDVVKSKKGAKGRKK